MDVGTLLRLRPFISTDGVIRMEIHPERSSGHVDDAGVPQTHSTQVTTNVMVPDGATIVIGGLMDNEVKRELAGLPLFSHLPGIGVLFRHTTDSTVKKELIVILTAAHLAAGRAPGAEPRGLPVQAGARTMGWPGAVHRGEKTGRVCWRPWCRHRHSPRILGWTRQPLPRPARQNIHEKIRFAPCPLVRRAGLVDSKPPLPDWIGAREAASGRVCPAAEDLRATHADDGVLRSGRGSACVGQARDLWLEVSEHGRRPELDSNAVGPLARQQKRDPPSRRSLGRRRYTPPAGSAKAGVFCRSDSRPMKGRHGPHRWISARTTPPTTS